MIRQDYILRMIEEIGRFLAKLSGLLRNQDKEVGYEEFMDFVKVHFGLKETEISLEKIDDTESKLKTGLEKYPDELGQLFLQGAEIGELTNRRDKAEVFYYLAWKAYRRAETESRSYRFDRIVEMNRIKEKLELMGINIDKPE